MIKKWFFSIIDKIFKNSYLSQNNDARCAYNSACLKFRLGKYEEVVNMQLDESDDSRLIAFFYDLRSTAKYRLKNKDNPVFKDIKNRAKDFAVLMKQKEYYKAFNLYKEVKLPNHVDVKKDCVTIFYEILQLTMQGKEFSELVEILTEINNVAKSVLKYDELALLIEFWAFQSGITSPQETLDFLLAAKKEVKDCLLVYPLIVNAYWIGVICADDMFQYLSESIDDGVYYAYFMRCFAHFAYNADSVSAMEDFEKFKSYCTDDDYSAIPLVKLQQLGLFFS